MKTKDSLFLLRSELTNKKDNNVDKCSFEKLLNARFLRETGKDTTTYNKELNIHVYNPSTEAQIYEIETVDFTVKASSYLSKAEEYIRKINFRYDWIQIKVNNDGKVLGILNKEELKNRWSRLKTAIHEDYKGSVIDFGLSKIDKQFDDSKEIEACIAQYFNFGLLFPYVPRRHKEDWTRSREIGFSDYEYERFEETIIYNRVEDNCRHYELSCRTFSNSLTTINNYIGNLCINENDIFPQSAEIEIEFRRDNIINQWSFELLRYN